LLAAWRDGVTDYKLGVYTPSGRLAMRDYSKRSGSYLQTLYNKRNGKAYEIFEEGNYAIVYFGKKTGWDNAPFLFARTAEGWQQDVVSQRKWVVMGRAPKWGVEKSNHPYARLLSRCPFWIHKDVPLNLEDRYNPMLDSQYVEQIIKLEKLYNKGEREFELLLEYGRLNALTSRRPQYTFGPLNEAKRLNPSHPATYKYLAIAHVRGNFQYQSAIREMLQYVKLLPDDPFGHNYLGYLYFIEAQYDSAEKEFKKAIKLQPDNCYAYEKLSRVFGKKYLKANSLNPLRNSYRKSALEMYQAAKDVTTPGSLRLSWLKSWLKGKKILK